MKYVREPELCRGTLTTTALVNSAKERTNNVHSLVTADLVQLGAVLLFVEHKNVLTATHFSSNKGGKL